MSMLLLPPMLMCGCIKGAGGVSRVISTELFFEEGNLASRSLLEGLAGG